MDTLDQNDSQQLSAGSSVDAVVNSETVSDNNKFAEEATSSDSVNNSLSSLSLNELIVKTQSLLSENVDNYLKIKNDVEDIKHAFYSNLNHEKDAELEKFVAEGGNKVDFVPAQSSEELQFKNILADFKTKRQNEIAKADAERERNLQLKKDLILQLNALIANPDDFGKKMADFRAIQTQWKSIGAVPAVNNNEIRDNFQSLVETFYDNLKIDNELRDYDFKKNLEEKTKICEEAEKLDAESDVIVAFRKLQTLHEHWAEIGPVSKTLREEIWLRFKNASSLINKKHAEHFIKLKEAEEDNFKKKSDICEKIEAVDTTVLSSSKDWQVQSDAIIELQKEWKTIGFAPKKFNTVVYERFRAACDKFFAAKSEFFKVLRNDFNDNLAKKIVLCEQAEALKDSTSWKETTDKLVKLQADWKTIGAVPHKQSDAVWKRFVTACDAFFDAKSKVFKDRKAEEKQNLQNKLSVIDKIQTFELGADAQAAADQLNAFVQEWNNIGFVPFKDKDTLYKSYRTALDEKVDMLRSKGISFRTGGERRSVASSMSDASRLQRDKSKLLSDISTYENNIGFLGNSKSASSLVESVKAKIAEMKAKISDIDSQIKALKEKESSEN